MTDEQTGGAGRPRRRLTEQQQRFVLEYLRCLNATEAARRSGYSVRNADKIGPRLTHKPHIRAVIDAALAERSERLRLKLETRELVNVPRRRPTVLIDLSADHALRKELHEWLRLVGKT